MSSKQLHLLAIIHDVMLGVAITGVALSVLLLAAFAYLAWNPISRPHLNRVSFRLIVYAIISKYAAVIFSLQIFIDLTPSPVCSFFAFLGFTTPMFSACMFCCVALNLQLVLVYGVNGNKMEKYYIAGSVLLCAICNVPTWIAGELGWYAANGTCWLRDPTPTIQLHWLVATQSVPMVLMSSIEVLSFFTILILMVRHQRRILRLRADTTCQTISESGASIATLASSRPQPPIVRYRRMILRIGLYPLLSCFFSITACVLDVYSVKNPVLTDLNLNLRIFDMSVYILRPILYALLTATDPSFLYALRALRPRPDLSTWNTASGELRGSGAKKSRTASEGRSVAPEDLDLEDAEAEGDIGRQI
ncbi:hypothetical protein DFH09DRAFT_1368687 [Mycena vulgaris]|nr:hypothetical protein DFH09DRAFT_1368687 [Mycena vulgaris]